MRNREPSAEPINKLSRREHPDCFVCGDPRIPGLKLTFREDQTGVFAECDCLDHWQGYPGQVHGGIIAWMIDGAMTHALFARGIAAVTADLRLRYRHPVELGRPVNIRADVTRESPPLFVVEAAIEQAGRLCARGEAKFMRRGAAPRTRPTRS
ncbi:MAG: PaaI family thioesterase [Phycisphaeraceae bacterium]